MNIKGFISFSTKLLQLIEFSSPEGEAKKAMIVLHGWGANQHDLVPLIQDLNLTEFHFIFPDAPFDVPGTASRGKGWFSFPPTGTSEKERLKSKSQLLSLLVETENRGFDFRDIVLLGFSQGAAMALDILLSSEKRLGAVIALSGFLIHDSSLHNVIQNIKETPLFIAHGLYDPILPFAQSKKSLQAMAEAEWDLTWREYPMAHEIISDEIDDIREFLIKSCKL